MVSEVSEVSEALEVSEVPKESGDLQEVIASFPEPQTLLSLSDLPFLLKSKSQAAIPTKMIAHDVFSAS